MKNVILFTIDTLRKDMLGCYGNTDNLTPYIDSLAEASTVFDNAVSTGPYTQASFPGILASSYFLEHGNPQMLSSKKTLISEVLQNDGITTAAIHSNAYLSNYFGWNRGWDHFYDSMQEEVTDLVPYVTGDTINRKATDWMRKHTQDNASKPFFLWMHYMDLHEPYVPAEKYVSQIDSSIELTEEQMFDMFTDTIIPRDTADPERVSILRTLYSAKMKQVDELVEDFFRSLGDLNLLENTIVILTADHGDEFGEHGGVSHDGKMFSELINVPLMFFDAQNKSRESVETLVSTLDVSPTIAHLFGGAAPESYRGQSLLPLQDYIPKGAFGEAVGKLAHKVKPTDRPVHFYQEGKLRITHRIEDDSWEMFDLEDDPKEERNIVGNSDLAEAMKNKLRAQIQWYDNGGSPVVNVTRF